MKRPAKPKKTHAPTCSCLLLCEDVVVSHASDKHNLIGIVGSIFVREVPTVVGGYVAYARTSNSHGDEKVELVIRRPSDNEPVMRIQASFQSATPLSVFTLVARLPAFRIDEPGRHMFSAESGGNILAQTPVNVIIPQEAKP